MAEVEAYLGALWIKAGHKCDPCNVHLSLSSKRKPKNRADRPTGWLRLLTTLGGRTLKDECSRSINEMASVQLL